MERLAIWKGCSEKGLSEVTEGNTGIFTEQDRFCNSDGKASSEESGQRKTEEQERDTCPG